MVKSVYGNADSLRKLEYKIKCGGWGVGALLVVACDEH